MKMISVEVDEEFAKAIDGIVKSSKLYSSRSEFIKDALRKNIRDTMLMGDDISEILKKSGKLAAEAKERGWNGKLLTKKEKEISAKRLLAEKGFR